VISNYCGDISMDGLLARRYVFWICFFTILSYASTTSQRVFAEDGDQINGDLNTQNSNNNNQSTTNIGSNAGSRTPVPTAIAPSMMSSGSDTCLKSRGTGLQLLDIGLSGGYYAQDEECNRRRDARLFSDLGMMIPAISRMCQNEDNWKAMFVSGTPCPILVGGRMIYGKRATLAMRSQPALYIPNYEDDEEYYNSVLGIGKQDEEDNEDNVRTVSVSERFRSSTRTESVE
jgi:hypothetical protein